MAYGISLSGLGMKFQEIVEAGYCSFVHQLECEFSVCCDYPVVYNAYLL